MNTTKRTWNRFGKASALVAGGLLAGAVLAGTISANAADTPTASATSSAESSTPSSTEGTRPAQPADPSQPQRADEQLLTGDVKSKVEAAVLASYPGATIQRTETDSGGVYESHIVTADGGHLTVLVGEDFAVTGTDDHRPRGA